MKCPLIENLTHNGKNCIIALKNNRREEAEVILESMVNELNDHMNNAKFGIQSDVYLYLSSLAKSKKRIHAADIYNDVPILEFKPVVNIKCNKSALNSVDNCERYVNTLIDKARKFIKEMCELRNDYVNKNKEQLTILARNKASMSLNGNVIDPSGGNYLKRLTKTLVIVNTD